ncbi:MAG: hypothetical protein WAO33_07810, partial [Candidatus Nanopelagicales bacterium]
ARSGSLANQTFPPKSACPVAKLVKHLWSTLNMQIITRIGLFTASVFVKESFRWLINTLRS